MSHSSSPNGTDKVFATVVHGPGGKTHVGCMWDQFWSLWAIRTGYIGLMSLVGGGCKQQRCRPACASA